MNIKKISSISLITLLSINLVACSLNTQQSNNIPQNLNSEQANNIEQNLNSGQTNTQQANNIPQTLSQNNIKISRDKAKEIALKEVPNGQIVSYEEDLYDYFPKYEIELIDNQYKYDLSISAIDGKIVEYEKESIYKY